MHIIIAVTNDLVTDRRVAKVAETLHNAGHSITLVGRILPTGSPINRVYKTKRFNLLFNKGALFYANYNIRLFFYLIFKKFDIIISNDLDTLLASYIASKIKNKNIIYDSHEYFTEVPELINRKFQQRIWLLIEKLILPKLKYTYTVSQSIADEYNKKYGTDFKVIRNLPNKTQPAGIEKQKVIIYQGALNIGRGIEFMIETMQYLSDYKLWIAGTGDIDNSLKKLANNLNLNNKVVFLGRLTPEKLYNYTCKAMLGLSLEEDLGKNYRFALPNKLFDYIQARIPVLVSDLPEMKKIVNEYNTGEILQSRKPADVALQIKNMLDNKSKYNNFIQNCNIAAEQLCWENEKKILLKIINNI
jgi:glycosyltransferase involved in cell wall biosynthesis